MPAKGQVCSFDSFLSYLKKPTEGKINPSSSPRTHTHRGTHTHPAHRILGLINYEEV